MWPRRIPLVVHWLIRRNGRIQVNRERRPFPVNRIGMDAPTVRLGDPLTDAQAEPRPFNRTVGVGVDAVIFVKDVGQCLLRDADTRIFRLITITRGCYFNDQARSVISKRNVRGFGSHNHGV